MTGDWIIISLLSVLAVAGAVVALVGRPRPVDHLCAKCRYPLGPTPHAQFCPECGTPAERVLISDSEPVVVRTMIGAMVSFCAVAFLANRFGPAWGEALADRFYSGAHAVRTDLDASSIIPADPTRPVFRVRSKVESDVMRDAAVRPRRLTLELNLGQGAPTVAPVKLALPLGADDVALRTFLEKAREAAAPLGIALDPATGLEAVRAAADQRALDPSLSIVGALANAWVANARTVRVERDSHGRRMTADVPATSRVPRVEVSSPGSFDLPSHDLGIVQSRASMAMRLGGLAYGPLIIGIVSRLLRPKYAPWPPK